MKNTRSFFFAAEALCPCAPANAPNPTTITRTGSTSCVLSFMAISFRGDILQRPLTKPATAFLQPSRSRLERQDPGGECASKRVVGGQRDERDAAARRERANLRTERDGRLPRQRRGNVLEQQHRRI